MNPFTAPRRSAPDTFRRRPETGRRKMTDVLAALAIVAAIAAEFYLIHGGRER
jgi:hypothetical protein